MRYTDIEFVLQHEKDNCASRMSSLLLLFAQAESLVFVPILSVNLNSIRVVMKHFVLRIHTDLCTSI